MAYSFGAYTPPPGLFGNYFAPVAASPAPVSAPPGSVGAGASTAYAAPVAFVPPPLGYQGSYGVGGPGVAAQSYGGPAGYYQESLVSFDAELDCKELNKAIVGAGTNEAALIKILAHRPRYHIEKLIHLYTRRYKASLYRHIKHDTSLNFKKALLKLLQPIEEVKAKWLHRAVKGIGTHDDSLIDVLAFSSNWEIRAIKWEYQCFYGKPGDLGDKLVRDIKRDTSMNFERALVQLCKGERHEDFFINQDQVMRDAQNLYSKGEGRLGSDDSFLIEVFCTRSPWHLAALNVEYQKLYGKDLKEVIKKETSGDFRTLLTALITPKAEWFAERLEYAMKGVGTHDPLLIFILTSTTEAERMAIRQKYEEKYKRTLRDRIIGDTSGHYQELLVSLISFGNEVTQKC